MKSIAVIPLTGSPFHEGHWDVGRKAALSFDTVIYALGFNPEKADVTETKMKDRAKIAKMEFKNINDRANKAYKTDLEQFKFDYFTGFLVDYLNEIGANAVVRGIRGIDDVGHEMKQQFWNEDLGMKIPTFLVIADRGLQHVSSSGIKQYIKVKELVDSDLSPQLRVPLFDSFTTPTETWPSP